MKKLILITGILFFAPVLLNAQAKDYKVVFDLTSKDTIDHKNVIKWITGIAKSDPYAQLEVVFYGQSLDLVTKGKSAYAESIATLAADKNISFSVCSIAMQRHNLDKSELIPGVQTVPDGIYEIISKQHQGWGYIKVTH